MLTGLLRHVPSEFRSCSSRRWHLLVEAHVLLPAQLMVRTLRRPYAPLASPFFPQTPGWCLLFVCALPLRALPKLSVPSQALLGQELLPLSSSCLLPFPVALLMLFHQLHSNGKDSSCKCFTKCPLPTVFSDSSGDHSGCSGSPAKYLPIADTWYWPRPVILSGFSHIPEICPVSLDPTVLELPAPAECWWLRIASATLS